MKNDPCKQEETCKKKDYTLREQKGYLPEKC